MSRKTKGCEPAVDKHVVGRVHGYLHPPPGKSSAPSTHYAASLQNVGKPSLVPHRHGDLGRPSWRRWSASPCFAPPPRKSHGRHNWVQVPLQSLLTLLCNCNLWARSVMAEGWGGSRGDEGRNGRGGLGCSEGRSSWRNIDIRSIVVLQALDVMKLIMILYQRRLLQLVIQVVDESMLCLVERSSSPPFIALSKFCFLFQNWSFYTNQSVIHSLLLSCPVMKLIIHLEIVHR